MSALLRVAWASADEYLQLANLHVVSRGEATEALDYYFDLIERSLERRIIIATGRTD